MKITKNGLKKPAKEDFYNIEDFNNNMDIIEEHLNDKDSHVDAKEIAQIEEASTLSQIEANDDNRTLWGKIKKAIRVLMGHVGLVATNSTLGHVKLSNNYTVSDGAASTGIGASSKAVADAYNVLNNAKENKSSSIIVKSNTDISSTYINGLVQYAGSTAATLTLPAPVSVTGGRIVIWNNSPFQVNIKTKSASIIGPGVGSGEIILTGGEICIFQSDSYNWIINRQINSGYTYSSGEATVDTTYNIKPQYGYVKWSKLGRLVVVDIYGVDIKPGFSTDNVAILASGLPAPQINETKTSATIFALPDGTARVWRLAVKTNGMIYHWYNAPTISASLNHSFCYISTD